MTDHPELPGVGRAERVSTVPWTPRVRHILASIAVLVLFAPPVVGQTRAETLRRADSLVAVAKERAEEFNRVAPEAQAAWARGDTASARSQELLAIEELDEAIALLRRAVSLYEQASQPVQAAQFHFDIGSMFELSMRFDSAVVYYRRSLDGLDRLPLMYEAGAAKVTVLRTLGENFERVGMPDSALAVYRRGMSITSPATNARLVFLDALADAHRFTARMDSALHYYESVLKALDIRPSPVVEVSTLLKMGTALGSVGLTDSALVVTRRGVAGARSAEDAELEALATYNLSFLELSASRMDSALVHARNTASLARTIESQVLEARAVYLVGNVHLLEDRVDSALVYFRDVLRIATENSAVVGSEFETRAAAAGLRLDALGAIGYAQMRLGEPDSALASLHATLDGYRGGPGWQVASHVLLNIAQLHHRVAEPPDLHRAAAYYDSASAGFSLMGTRVTSDAEGTGDPLRLSYMESSGLALTTTVEWALAWLGLGSEVGRERAALAALAAAELGRGQAMLELVRGKTERSPGGSLVAEGERLADGLRESGSPGVVYLVTPDTLVSWLVQPSGPTTVFRRATPADSIATLVEGFRAWIGADEAAGLDRLARGGPALERPGLRGSRSRRRAGGVAEAGDSLATLLFPPELMALLPPGGEIVVLPHGPLNLLPFAALPAVGTGEPLASRFAVRYTPSLELLQARTEQTGLDDRERLVSSSLVVGNPAMPSVRTVGGDSVRLSPLPGAATEARWLADSLGARLVTSGTESEVRERLPTASLVHLATHGFAYSSSGRARESWIALTPDPTHDGLLTVGELLDQVPTLQAELVVLSACQTGLGDVRFGEGTVGLQRAFLAQGARTLLVSLWSVSDEASNLLMQSFYRHWLRDADRPGKAEALRRAQNDLRQLERFRSPLYWAAFQLVGAG